MSQKDVSPADTTNSGFAASVVRFVLTALSKFLALLGKKPTTSAPALSADVSPTESVAPQAPSTVIPAIAAMNVTPIPTVINQVVAPHEEEKLGLLYPPFGRVVRALVIEARRRSMAVGVYAGLRTFDEQDRLYAQGRTTPGSIVTRARAGYSFHNYGVAVDLVFDGVDFNVGWKWSWDGKFPWRELALLGQNAFGLETAYFWKSFPEAPHQQWTFGYKEHECLAAYQKGGLPEVWKLFDARLRDPVHGLKYLSQIVAPSV